MSQLPIESLVMVMLASSIKERDYTPREAAAIAEAAEMVLRSVRDVQPIREGFYE